MVACGRTALVDFLCYHRDRPGSMALREELQELHWSYMDGYAAEMVVRGPTLTDDGETATGSVHIAGLSGPVRRAGVCLRRAQLSGRGVPRRSAAAMADGLGRTMWDFPGGPEGGNRYFVLGFGAGPGVNLDPPPDRNDLIAYGPLLSDAGDIWLGTAALVRSPDPQSARALLTQERYVNIEVHNWRIRRAPIARRRGLT